MIIRSDLEKEVNHVAIFEDKSDLKALSSLKNLQVFPVVASSACSIPLRSCLALWRSVLGCLELDNWYLVLWKSSPGKRCKGLPECKVRIGVSG